LKAKIQQLAASEAERALLYYPFGDEELRSKLEFERFRSELVGDFYRELLEYGKNKIRGHFVNTRGRSSYKLIPPWEK
jgi:hypothetical protein